MKLTTACTVLAAVLGLSACGGGGGSNSTSGVAANVQSNGSTISDISGQPTVQSTDSFPIDAVMSTLAQTPKNYVLHATDSSGVVHTLSISRQPDSTQQTFGSSNTATRVADTEIMTVGTISTTWLEIIEYVESSPSPYLLLGYRDQMSGEYAVADTSAALPLPINASVNDAGNFGPIAVNQSDSVLTVDAIESSTWQLKADTAHTAWLCINTVKTPVSGSPTSVSYCHQINNSGTVLGLVVKITQNGQTLTYK